MEKIEVKGFTIYDTFVDESVGISAVTYTVDGPFFFSDGSELEFFRGALCAVFELVCDTPKALTFEEDEMERKHR